MEALTDGEGRFSFRRVRPGEMHQTFNFEYLYTPWNASALRAVIDVQHRFCEFRNRIQRRPRGFTMRLMSRPRDDSHIDGTIALFLRLSHRVGRLRNVCVLQSRLSANRLG